MTPAGLRLHHVGCLVANIEEASAEYLSGPLAQPVTQSIRVSASQQVRVAFVGKPPETLIELVEPEPGNRFLQNLLKRGITLLSFGLPNCGFARH